MFRSISLLLLMLSVGFLVGCDDDDDDNGTESAASPEATITRTTHGTAHITADNFEALGFGQGFAFAEDRFCTLMDQVVKVRSERARFLGPGEEQANIVSDLAYHALNLLGRAQQQLTALDPEALAMMEGYVAGYNAYLAETGADNLPGSCAGEPWVSAITVQDLMAYYLDLATLAGSRNFLPAFANAAPPETQIALAPMAPELPRIPKDHASNGIAVGDDYTANGRGALLSNTHLPWEGETIYHEVHLTIPGELDVAGVSLAGGIGVQIGFNQSMAWTHTTSPSNQFLIYQLQLADDDPTAYMLDGERLEMEERTVTVEVAGLDAPIEQTVYDTVFGPVLEIPQQLPWTNTNAFAIYDPNLNNGRFIGTFLDMARAGSVRELRDVFLEKGGVPWNHTLATDSTGETFYADTPFVPFLAPPVEGAFLQAVATDPALAAAFEQGLVILDGSVSVAMPVEVPGFPVPGAIPFDRAPQTFRDDFVMNSNDSFWLPNPKERLEAISRLYGDPGTEPRSFRTRMGLTQLGELTPGQVSAQTLQDLLFANRSFTAELWQSEICQGDVTAVQASDGQSMDLTQACGIIANWDGRLNRDSVGAVLYREAMDDVKTLTDDGMIGDTAMFSVPYDPADPVNTPSGLTSEGRDLLQTGLADAVQRLQANGFALDVPLGDVQFTLKNGDRIPIHGGLQVIDGAFNKVEYRNDANLFTSTLSSIERGPVVNEPTNLTEDGYVINYGASYIMAVAFTDEGPSAEAVLTYSQSNDPESPFFRDQTELFSNKEWRGVPFSAEAVEAATVSSKTVSP